MEKALEILTNLLQAKSYDENYPSDYEIQEAIREINNYVDESESIRMLSDDMGGRIAELEEAQETIKDLKHNYDVQVEYNNTAYKNYTNMVNSLEQRIEAIKPKTCEGCKYKPNDGECYYEPCGTCARFFYDHYELKGNA